MKYYTLLLPVFKQGDDLSSFLNEDGSNGSIALLELANQYEEAAEICKKISVCLEKSKKKIQVDACAHHIGIYASSKDVNDLLDQNLLQEDKFED